MNAQWVLEPEAIEHALAADEWWREHRRDAPDLFRAELAAASTLLRHMPEAGRLKPHDSIPGRRILNLRRTRYQLHYIYDDEAKAVVVLGIWSAWRGNEPEMRRRQR